MYETFSNFHKLNTTIDLKIGSGIKIKKKIIVYSVDLFQSFTSANYSVKLNIHNLKGINKFGRGRILVLIC